MQLLTVYRHDNLSGRVSPMKGSIYVYEMVKLKEFDHFWGDLMSNDGLCVMSEAF